MLLRSNFSSFPLYFQNVSNLGVRLHIHSVKGGCSINCFPESANLICRSTDISNCFIESLGVRDNESRLYILVDKSEIKHYFWLQKLVYLDLLANRLLLSMTMGVDCFRVPLLRKHFIKRS